MTEKTLSPAEFRATWEDKAVLRAVYTDYYRRIMTWCPEGPRIEIGAGSGNLKDHLPEVVATDVVDAAWLDAVVDAQVLPFPDASIGALVGVDVLHHLERPRLFLGEAERTLRPGGRIVLIEPAITPVSWVVFKLGHPEPIILKADPLVDARPTGEKHPMDSNQAVPTLLVGRHRHRVETLFPHLRVVHREWLSLLAYPLSGGFRPWSLMPARFVEPVLRLESRLLPRLGRVAGFRLLLVVERA